MALIREPDMFSEELDKKRKKFIGNFDTRVRCRGSNCMENIIDHATEQNLYANLPRSEQRYGPGPSSHERLLNFRVCHGYWCDCCGLTYHNEVIEGALIGYIPHERRKE